MKQGKGVRLLLRCGLCVAIGAPMSLLILKNYGYATDLPAAERCRILCDAFTVPGVLMLMVGCLVALSNAGALLGLVYTLRHLASRLIPAIGHREETYYEYLERRREKGGVRGYGFLFLTGGAFLAVALVFFVLFYKTA